MTTTTLPDLRARLRQLVEGAPGADSVMTPTDTLRDCSFWLTLEAAHRAATTPQTGDQLEDDLQQVSPEVDWALAMLEKNRGDTNDRLRAVVVALRRMAYARLLDNAATVRWADPVVVTAETRPIDLTGKVDQFPPRIRLAVGGDTRAYVMEAEEPDAVDQIIDAMTPPHLARRPGELLHDAFTYVMGDDHDHGPEAWADVAAQFQRLLAKGAQPAPTDLPMDGSTADDRALLEVAVRSLEEFGTDRALAPGGYRQDRLDRMNGAARSAGWIRACMSGSAKLTHPQPDGPDTVTVSLRFTPPDDCPDGHGCRGEDVHLNLRGSGTITDAVIGSGSGDFVIHEDHHSSPAPDLRSDSGELPAPPMAGVWEVFPHNPRCDPMPCDSTTWVVVATDREGPFHTRRAGSLEWSDRNDVDDPIRWWRPASQQEIAVRRAKDDSERFAYDGPVVDLGGFGVGAPPAPGTPEWCAMVDRRLAQLETHAHEPQEIAPRVVQVLQDMVRSAEGQHRRFKS